MMGTHRELLSVAQRGLVALAAAWVLACGSPTAQAPAAGTPTNDWDSTGPCFAPPHVAPAASGLGASIVFQDQTDKAFVFQDLCVTLDKHAILSVDQRRVVAERARNGASVRIDLVVDPGPHVLQARVVLQGDGQGNFAYLKHYRFDIRTSRAFTAEDGIEIGLVALDVNLKGPIEERPGVAWTVKRPKAGSNL